MVLTLNRKPRQRVARPSWKIRHATRLVKPNSKLGVTLEDLLESFEFKPTPEGEPERDEVMNKLRGQSSISNEYFELDSGVWYIIDDKTARDWLIDRAEDWEIDWLAGYSIESYRVFFKDPHIHMNIEDAMKNSWSRIATAKTISYEDAKKSGEFDDEGYNQIDQWMRTAENWKDQLVDGLIEIDGLKDLVTHELAWGECVDVKNYKGKRLFIYCHY